MLATTLTALLIIGALLTGVTGILYWRAAHSTDVRRVVVALRETLTTVIANGGLDAPTFLDPEQQRTVQELEDLVGRVNDRKLRDGCREVLDGYGKVWASAPPEPGPRAAWVCQGEATIISDRDADRRRDEQHFRQVDDARPALDAIDRVLDRVNALERFLVRRG
jgi:hypothetical protein